VSATSLLVAERTEVAAASRRLAAAGLVRGTSGNVSARAGDLVAITPTGAVLADLEPDQVAVVSLDGEQRGGPLAPTSEIELHLSVYADRADAGAVVHTHAPAATALACVLEGELPCVHYEMLLLGGPVRIAPYATFGTPELAASCVAGLRERTAVLLANHGTVTLGADLAAAVNATELLEWASELYARAAALGTPRALGEDDRRAVVEAAAARAYGTTKPV
jgi:L-fuculose-phosphate aldolase